MRRCSKLMETSLHWLDWAVIVSYFILVLAVGLWAGRRVKETRDYFLGGRKFSVWLIIGQAFGVGTHAEMPVSLAGKVYLSGYSGIWYQWKNLFITPFYWILAPLFRRFRRTTIGEVYEDRYGSFMGQVYTLFALAFITLSMGAMLKGAGKLVAVAMGSAIDPNTVVVAMTIAFVGYSFAGGLFAVAYTDFVQSFFIIALSFLLIPKGLQMIGGFEGMRESLSPEMLSMVTPGDIGVFTILMLTVNGLIGIVAQPHILASVGTGHNEFSCRMGMAAGNFVKRFCTIGWALVGLVVAAMLIQQGRSPLEDSEEAFGLAARELLSPGLVGLLLASVLAANMSTGSAFTVDGGALFTQNLYRRYWVKDRSDKHYLTVGRFAGITVTAAGVVVGVLLTNVLQAFLFIESIAAFMGVSMFGAICWPRANRWGAFASLLVSWSLFLVLTYQEFGVFLRWEAANFGIAIVAGFLTLIVVSLLTKPESEDRLLAFYERLNQPTESDPRTGEEKPVTEPGHDLLFVHLFDLQLGRGLKHFYRRFRVDLKGLTFAFGVVVFIIVLAKAILYLP